jgi:hypothetical protein
VTQVGSLADLRELHRVDTFPESFTFKNFIFLAFSPGKWSGVNKVCVCVKKSPHLKENICENLAALLSRSLFRVSVQGLLLKRGGLGGSVKCPKSTLQPFFQVGYVMEFGEHSTKHPHTKFQTQILMCGKAVALGSLLHTLL